MYFKLRKSIRAEKIIFFILLYFNKLSFQILALGKNNLLVPLDIPCITNALIGFSLILSYFDRQVN